VQKKALKWSKKWDSFGDRRGPATAWMPKRWATMMVFVDKLHHTNYIAYASTDMHLC